MKPIDSLRLASLTALTALWACGDAGGSVQTEVDVAEVAEVGDAADNDGLDDDGSDTAVDDELDDDVQGTDSDAESSGDSDGAGDGGTDAGSDRDAAPDSVGEPDAGSGPDTDPDPDADAGTDTDPGPTALFDMAMIGDPATAECSFTNHRTRVRDLQPLDVWDVTYLSWESIDGVLQPIRIRGYAARPQGARGLPGVVHMHGLGGAATEAMATGPAALLDAFVLAPTGPGGGTEPTNTSEGLPAGHASNYRLFDTVIDVRGSWFWGHAVVAMRGVTCLADHDDVDADRLGMTGFSAGGVVSLIAAGVDARLDAVVPLSGTGAWEESMRSPAAWQWGLLTLAGLDASSPEWLNVNTRLDPARVIAGAPSAAVMMVNGSTDEFFALNAHVATYDAIPPERLKRTSIVANFDHGCYALTGVESSATIEARATAHAEGAQQMWFGHVFGTDADFAVVPREPTVSVSVVGAVTIVAASVDDPAGRLDVESVEFWASGDNALTFAKLDLDAQGGELWGATTFVPLGPSAVYFVDVTYRTRDLIGARSFTLSSRPQIPPGHVPAIRQSTSCLR